VGLAAWETVLDAGAVLDTAGATAGALEARGLGVTRIGAGELEPPDVAVL
jgi:hypothetical protein